MSANCQLVCSLLTETTCSTLSLDLSALKDTCSSLASRLEFICKLKGLNLPRFVLTYRDWAKYDYCPLHHGPEFPSTPRKHGFGEYILHVLFPIHFILSLSSLCHVSYIWGGIKDTEGVLQSPFLLLFLILSVPDLSLICKCPRHLDQSCMYGASDLELDCRVSSVLTLTLEHRISLCLETSCEGELVIFLDVINPLF